MSDTRKRILDKMKLEISDSIFDEATCSCDTILNKLNYIIKNGVAGGGGGGVSHHFGNVAHGQTLFLCQVGQQEKLRKRDFAFCQFRREAQNAAPLREKNKISKTLHVLFFLEFCA